MSRKNQNNRAAWAKRVSEYDVIPDDDVSNTEDSWDNLQRRYKNRPSKRRIYIYWAAAVIIAMIVIPLLWNSDKNNTEKLQDKPIVIQPSIKVTLPDEISKPDSQQLLVNKKVNETDLEAKKNSQLPAVNNNIFFTKDQKDTTELVTTHDTPNLNKSVAIVNIKQDTVHEKQNTSIVHINNISTDQPEPEVDDRKLRKFMRRYDVDVPHKTDATGTINNGSTITNIN